ncbi:MAG: hypothetical protein ACREMB_03690 [Candidatus Rokuibacteriota bacterium]
MNDDRIDDQTDQEALESFAGKLEELARTLSDRERAVLAVFFWNAMDPLDRVRHTQVAATLSEQEREVLQALEREFGTSR